jgi:serine/threonine-protein kinase
VLSPGDEFEGYLIDARLGRGGSALVYSAHEVAGTNRAVALKVLDARHREPAHLSRLHREFRFAQQAAHPHVVTMYGAGPDWLSMQYVDGGTADKLLTPADKLAALGQIAAALDHSHRTGIVHCDVKPSNILVAKDFSAHRAVLIDFGAAHALAEEVHRHPTHVEASLPYAAPELLSGRTPTPSVDEYALACTAVELISGRPPFTANTQMALVNQHLHHAPPRLSHKINWVPHAFDSILARAMAKDPEARYDSCTEFVSLITRALR